MAANVRAYEDLERERFKEQGCFTPTSIDQVTVEESVNELFETFFKLVQIDPEAPALLRERHISFLKKCLTHLSVAYECLDSSRPWLCYWILHSLELLDEQLQPRELSKIVQFLARCQSPEGGFGGGPGQYPHLAPTYAAVNSLCIIGTEEAYKVINREKLREFLWSVRSSDGAFHMHVGGEVDIRGLYCALDVARLTNIFSDDLFDLSAEWIIGCQTYEGGFSGVPGMEAHGGYAFCGLAALSLLGRESLCDIKALLRWNVNRQMRFEGGFQGRTNKLVDGCYSFWQGGAFPLIHRILSQKDGSVVKLDHWLFHQEALQEYLLVCCQSSSGGLLDKPHKPRDVYHTCYGLSGLSVAQHFSSQEGSTTCIVGNPNNELAPLHPVYNIGFEAVMNAQGYFQGLGPLPPQASSSADALSDAEPHASS
ncbi:protein farnesyltransferase subunit beta [Hetaerina americana]|uniref:protein farnesyltransferase subunit beta n=1 Tax=Hetaerina americana TaxID=62018 RepID=UPI003A7F1590